MTRGLRGALALSLAVLLGACFASRRPLGPPAKGTLDHRLLATWACRPPEKIAKDAEQEGTLSVAAFDETQYVVQWHEKGSDPEYYRVYSSRVGGEALLNVKALGTAVGGGVWAFVRYRIEPDGRLRTWIVEEKAVGERGDAGLAIVRRRVGDPTLYQDLMTCTRKE